MDAIELMVRLRRCGVVVHHVSEVRPVGPAQRFVVFLEGALGQHDRAERCARRMGRVAEVEFSKSTRAIMYVTTTERPVPASAPPT